ncbi:MAG: hypothetical protein ACXWN0_15415, partial [Isosphaeraceae bacterium]
WRTDAETLAFLKDRARNDEHEDVRRAAVRELARGWRTDPETLAFLEVKELAPEKSRSELSWRSVQS